MLSGYFNPDRRNALLGILSAAAACRKREGVEKSAGTVRVVVTRGSFLYLPVYFAASLGYFRDHGLNVLIEETASVPRSAQALVSGGADIAAAGILRPLLLQSENRKVTAFVVMHKLPGFGAVVSPRASRRITTLQDIKGANVGTSSTGNDYHLIWDYILSHNGLRPGDTQVVPVGTGAAHAAALERGHVDVGLVAGTTIPLLEARYPRLQFLVDTRTTEGTLRHLGVKEMPGGVLYAKTEWLQKNPAIVTDFVRSVRNATDWIRSAQAGKVRDLLPESSRTEEAIDRRAIQFTIPMLSDNGRFLHESVQAAWDILTVSSETARRITPNLGESYTNRWV